MGEWNIHFVMQEIWFTVICALKFEQFDRNDCRMADIFHEMHSVLRVWSLALHLDKSWWCFVAHLKIKF